MIECGTGIQQSLRCKVKLMLNFYSFYSGDNHLYNVDLYSSLLDDITSTQKRYRKYWYDKPAKAYTNVLHIIKRSPVYAYAYAAEIIKGRWIEAEPYIMKNARFAFEYNIHILNKYRVVERWLDAEEYLMKDPEFAFHYARSVIKDRWYEAEPYIKTNIYWSRKYSSTFKLDWE